MTLQNLEVHRMAIMAERRDLDRGAARGWLAAEAARGRRERAHSARLRWAVGAALIRVGGRLQGSPWPAPTASPAA